MWGGNYLWKDCLYLNKAKQPRRWKPNEDIRKNSANLAKTNWLKKAIGKVQASEGKQPAMTE